MLKLNENDRVVAQAEGFLTEWLKDSPVQVKASLDYLIQGIAHYRTQAQNLSDDFDRLQTMYNNLSVQAAIYLNDIAQLRSQQEDYQLAEQRPLHQKEETGSQS